MAEELVVTWNEEVCPRFKPSGGLGPLIDPHSSMPHSNSSELVLALGLLVSGAGNN